MPNSWPPRFYKWTPLQTAVRQFNNLSKEENQLLWSVFQSSKVKVIGNSSYLLTEKVEQLKNSKQTRQDLPGRLISRRHTSFLCSCIRILATQGGLHLKKKSIDSHVWKFSPMALLQDVLFLFFFQHGNKTEFRISFLCSCVKHWSP